MILARYRLEDPMLEITLAIAAKLLSPRNRHDLDWSVQGFGMLRTRLANGVRLHLWHSGLQYKPMPSDVHDHPWSFRSIVLCGRMINDLWKLCAIDEAGAIRMRKVRIKCGEGGGVVDEPAEIEAYRATRYVLNAGDCYYQHKSELHSTGFTDGAMTLIKRSDFDEHPDFATVLVEGNQRWISAEPRKATQAEVEMVCDAAMTQVMAEGHLK